MEFEVKLFNMLDILGYKDYYFDLPVIIKNLRQAEDFTSTMLAKVTKFENLSEKYERNLRFRAKSSYWRGLVI